MNALGYDDPSEVSDDVRKCLSIKEGCLTWEEFLSFFFKDPTIFSESFAKEDNHKSQDNKENKEVKQLSPGVPRYKSKQEPVKKEVTYNYDDPDKKPVKMTNSLKMLEDTRKSKTEKEVEDEFRQLQEKKLFDQKSVNKQSPSKSAKKQLTYD